MSNGGLILAGGGNAITSRTVDELYFALIPKGGKILHIPMARDLGAASLKKTRDWFSRVLLAHNRIEDISLTMLSDEKEIPSLHDFDSIYIGGGNTFKLLDWIINSGFGSRVIDEIKRGGLVYGGSAGAMVMGVDIRAAESEREHYTISKGLGLVGPYAIDCHYEVANDEVIANAARQMNAPVIAIPENSGVLLNAELKLEKVIGAVTIFDAQGKKLPAGTAIEW